MTRFFNNRIVRQPRLLDENLENLATALLPREARTVAVCSQGIIRTIIRLMLQNKATSDTAEAVEDRVIKEGILLKSHH